jgi:hypothetical protein
MDAISRAWADIWEIVDEGGSPESLKLRIGRVFEVLERQITIASREPLMPPASGCRTCGESQCDRTKEGV